MKPSNIQGAGEGLFAARDIETDQVIAYFNGVPCSSFVDSIGGDEKQYKSDYMIGGSCMNQDNMNGCVLTIDIPENCRTTDFYRATLAHKICHSFSPNAKYDFAFHPRFGKLLRCAVSLREIKRGEEVTCDYKYRLTKAPEWYVKCLRNHLITNSGLSEEGVNILLKQAVLTIK